MRQTSEVSMGAWQQLQHILPIRKQGPLGGAMLLCSLPGAIDLTPGGV